ncbi:unnamed protein product [Rhodiola kirilowii]
MGSEGERVNGNKTELRLPTITYTKLFINGQFVDAVSGKTFETVDPRTEQIITRVAEGDKDDIDLAVQAARAAFDSGPWPRLPGSERGRVMMKFAELVEQHAEEIAELDAVDGGKLFEWGKAVDVPTGASLLRYYAGAADKIHGEVLKMSSQLQGYTLREPVGVVGHIIPWNFPTIMFFMKVSPALAAGCTVVLKPASRLRSPPSYSLISLSREILAGLLVVGIEHSTHPLTCALRQHANHAMIFLWYVISSLSFTLSMKWYGKIAASSGHASWISSKMSRSRVFELRGRSDAVIVGGNTVRRDNPRLTARHGGQHVPVRIVMSQTLNLPEVANIWDVIEVPTIVVTQRGANRSFQKLLASKGVEVIEFDMLNPRDVMEYFYDRGYLSILWECGGSLAAPAISAGVIHKVYAFVAPKIIGGKHAPTPVGELGMVEMTQALDLLDVNYEQVGPDMLVSGFLQPIPDLAPVIPSVNETFAIDPSVSQFESKIIFFYKTWDPYGALSNFSHHPIQMPDDNGNDVTWQSVEHYYQANKFTGVNDPMALECLTSIKSAASPEEAARKGRTLQRQAP